MYLHPDLTLRSPLAAAAGIDLRIRWLAIAGAWLGVLWHPAEALAALSLCPTVETFQICTIMHGDTVFTIAATGENWWENG